MEVPPNGVRRSVCEAIRTPPAGRADPPAGATPGNGSARDPGERHAHRLAPCAPTSGGELAHLPSDRTLAGFLTRAIASFALLALAASCQPVLAAGPGGGVPGSVRFAKVANSAFDVYTRSPTDAHKAWMRAHYARLLAYAPYFDSRLSWFRDAWVYKDLYAIYVGSALASEHPDWILHDADGNQLYIPYACAGGTCTQWAGDPGNTAFRAFWIEQARATLRAGYRGLFVDDVNLFLSRVSDGHAKPVVPRDPRTAAPMTEADWRRYMAEFTEQIRAAFRDKEIVHNAIWYVGPSDPFVQRELASADVISIERGVNDSGLVRGGGTYGFESLLAYIDAIHARGGRVWFDAGAKTDAGREFGLASYFLVSTGGDYIGNDPRGTPDDWWPGYDVSLGTASGERRAWDGVLRRDFERGFVLVNQPGSPKQTVALDGTWVDLAGREQTAVTLGPAEGAVLRHPPGAEGPLPR
jgi:putative glycosyl hydrolase-like family 15 (GHL15) protein